MYFKATTWNQSDKSTDVTLSISDLTATKTVDGYGSFRSLLGITSGKYYWEITVDLMGANHVIQIGVGDGGVGLTTNNIGYFSGGYAYFAVSGVKMNNGVSTLYGSTYITNDIISVALDMDAGKIWWAKNGVWIAGGDPEAGTNEAFSGLSGTFYAMATLYNVDDAVTANFGASAFTYSVPSGFNLGLGYFFEESDGYTGEVYYYNISLEPHTDYIIKLILNEDNFNFDLAQSNGYDFRLAERSNGSGILKMWVAAWDKDNKYAVLWFKIPFLSSDSKSTFYAFWGGVYSEDISTPQDLNFLFYEDFKTGILDMRKWVGKVDSGVSLYGCLFPSGSSFTTNTNPLFGKNNWIIEAGVYLVNDTSCDLTDRAHGFEFIDKMYGVGPATWNPEDKASYISLSNANLTVACSNTTPRGVRSTWYRDSGKWYWEVKVTGGEAYGTCIGIANTFYSLVFDIGQNSYGYSYHSSGYTVHANTYLTGFDPYVLNDVIGVALDLNNEKIWWSKNGVWQGGGDPSVGTGARYSDISGAWYAAVSLPSNLATVLTANFGSTEFSYTPPSGFVPWAEGEPIMETEADGNDFVINMMHNTRVEHNAIEPGGSTYQNIDQTYGGLEFDSYQEHYIAYYEPEDKIYQKIVNRKTYADIENKIDRKVEGNTRINNVRLHGRQTASTNDGAYPSYISWFVIREYDNLSSVNLDGSELYIQYENVEHQPFDHKDYTDDLTSIDYIHNSSFGGDAYKISNNITSDAWYSDEEAVLQSQVYTTIYFDRTENLVSPGRLHYNSNHEKFYGAVKMSDSDLDVHGRDHWRAESTNAWAIISFDSDRPIVNVFGIRAVSDDLDSCPNNYKFYGGLEPYHASFKLLHEGSFTKTAEWQSVTFINKNPYKYYKFEIIDTYGNEVKVQEWLMYGYIGTDKPKYISQLRLHSADFGGLEDNFPKQISLEGSNDMLNWEVVMPLTNTYTPYISHNVYYGKWQRYSFTNIKGYWHYRLACKDNWGASDGRIIIGEWEMCELETESDTHRILAGSTNNIKQIWASDTCGFEDDHGLMYIGNEKLSVVQGSKLVEEKDISEFYNDINVV